MAKPLVTQAQVNESAEALVSAGQEPTILTVQERIGGGSYSTIKKYLDVWKQQRVQTPQIALPPALVEQGTTLVRNLWLAALALAEQQVAQVRAEAEQQIVAAQRTQAEAEAALARLEATLEEQEQLLVKRAQEVANLQAELEQAHLATNTAQVRATTLEQHLVDLRAELERRDTPAYQQLAQEMMALKTQVAQLVAQPPTQAQTKQRKRPSARPDSSA